MNKRAIGIVGVAVVIGAAVLYGKACSNKAENPSAPTSEKKEATGAARPSAWPPGSVVVMPMPSASASALPPGEDPSKPEEVFFSKWGGGKGELGRERRQEGNAEGPMSLTLDANGRTLVLDQVNGRVARYGADGKLEATIPITQHAAQDIAAGKDGSIAVLDRFSSKSVGLYDPQGNYRGEIPLEGEGVPETGELTGVFVDGDKVYVEREHGPLVHVGSVSGAPAEPREEIPGRPSRDGLSFLKAGIIEPEVGRVYVASMIRETQEHRFTRELRLDGIARTILLLDSDKSGVIYLAVGLERPGQGETVFLACLEPLQGGALGSAVLPVNTLPEESFRDFSVLDEGGVVFALRTEEGVSYQRVDCH